jgi:hypothetical protein
MTQLPAWTYVGVVPITDDLSVLEAALHSGRVAAAERGYPDEPVSIETVEAMLVEPSEVRDGEDEYRVDDEAADGPGVLTAEEAQQRGLEFVPTVLRFQMEWAPAVDQS